MTTTAAASLAPTQRRQIIALTVGAVLLFGLSRWIPTGTDLHRTDFEVTGEGRDRVIEFCDPANPQFLPVVAMRSPVTFTLAAIAPVQAGRPAEFTLRLATASGRPIAPVDLLVAHTRKLHLMVVDPTLDDYHHVHPEPVTDDPGAWTFALTPRAGGTYRVFADFTPAVTARGLYAAADFEALAPARPRVVGVRQPQELFEADGLRYRLAVAGGGAVRSREQARLKFTVERDDGGVVGLEPVMDAYAHLVAFDEARSGFAHLHPEQVDLGVPPDARRPELTFLITIPEPGRYVIWAQVNVQGTERYAPFWFDVLP